MSVPERNSGSEGKEEESEDESEILEESPCGRWQKRKEQVGALGGGSAQPGLSGGWFTIRGLVVVFTRGSGGRVDALD